MQTNEFCLIILIFIGLQCAHTKTLVGGKGLEKHEAIQAESQIQHRSILNENREDSVANTFSEKTPNFRFPKINGQSLYCFDFPSAKRSTKGVDFVNKRDSSYNRQHCYNKNFNGYGIVYKQGKPMGILEPISKIYESHSIQMNDLRKRDADDAEAFSSTDEMHNYAKYASTLANFKMHNYGDYESLHNSNLNREQSKQKRSDLTQILTLREKRSIAETNISSIGNNLKNVINDFGLFKDNIQKRNTLQEDKNSFNKILVQKELHPNEHNKKENCMQKITNEDSSLLRSSSKQLHKSSANFYEDYVTIPDWIDPLYKTIKKQDIKNFRQREPDNVVRNKKEHSHALSSKINNEITKNLEKSEELAVNGNKSPLTSFNTWMDSESKLSTSNNEKDEKRDRQATEQEIDKRVKRDIKKGLSKVTKETKSKLNEIKKLQQCAKHKRQINSEIEQNSAEKPYSNKNKVIISYQEKRVKRNLQQPKISKFNSHVCMENFKNGGHVREHRNVVFDEDAENKQVLQRGLLPEIYDKKVEKFELTKRNGFESKLPLKKINHKAKNYEFLTRKKRNKRKIYKGCKKLLKFEVAKQNLNNGGVFSKDLENSHSDAQCHNVVKIMQNKPSTRATASINNNEKVVMLTKQSNEVNHSVMVTRSTHAKEPLEIKSLMKEKLFKAPNKRNIENLKIFESSLNQIAHEPPKYQGELTDNVCESKINNEGFVKASKLTNERKAPDKNKRSPEQQNVEKDVFYLNEKRSVHVNKSKSDRKALESKTNDQSTSSSKPKTVIRLQKRKSAPNLSLENLQKIDFKNNLNRRRRNVIDYQRNKYIKPNKTQFRIVRAGDEKIDNNDVFDNNSFEDCSATLNQKRATPDSTNNHVIGKDYKPKMINLKNLKHGHLNKRNAIKNFATKINADVYETPNYLYADCSNKHRKRDANFAVLHTSVPILRHLVAVKERNLQHDELNRNKRLEKTVHRQTNGNKVEMSKLSVTDIFADLSQSYEGELTRFKRVKRDNSVKTY